MSEPAKKALTLHERQEQIAAAEKAREAADRAVLQGTLDRLLARAAADQALRESLPCFEKADEPGADACNAAGAWRGCKWHGDPAIVGVADLCARARMKLVEIKRGERTIAHLDARSQVPALERDLLLAAALRTATLERYPSLLAVRDWLAEDKAARPPLLLLSGPTGRGKTVSACYAIGRLGGLYVLAYELARPGFDVLAASAVPCLVIDQLGRENIGASSFAVATLEETLDRRYSSRRPTVLCGNLSESQFIARYNGDAGERGVIADRWRAGGRFVPLDGDSYRGAK